jgi:hypothetical protein
VERAFEHKRTMGGRLTEHALCLPHTNKVTRNINTDGDTLALTLAPSLPSDPLLSRPQRVPPLSLFLAATPKTTVIRGNGDEKNDGHGDATPRGTATVAHSNTPCLRQPVE